MQTNLTAIKAAIQHGDLIKTDLSIVQRQGFGWKLIQVVNTLKSIVYPCFGQDAWREYRLDNVAKSVTRYAATNEQDQKTAIEILELLKGKAKVASTIGSIQKSIEVVQRTLQSHNRPIGHSQTFLSSLQGANSLSLSPVDKREEDEKILSHVRDAIGNFARVFTEYKLKGPKPESFCFSPISIVAVLGMLLCIVKDPKKIMQKIGLGNLSEAEVHRALSTIIERSKLENFKDGTITFAQMVGYKNESLTEEYLNSVTQAQYKGTVCIPKNKGTVCIPKKGENLAALLNREISDRTHGIIKDLVPADTYFALLNVIYLKLKWEEIFEKSDGYNGQFHCVDGTTAPAKMMKQETTFKSYGPSLIEDDERSGEPQLFRMLEKSYLSPDGHEISYLIFFPTKKTTAADLSYLRQYLTNDNIQKFRGQAAEKTIKLHMPKSELRMKVELTAWLQGLGIDVTDINREKFPGPIELWHEAYMKTEEEGTEAAAATAYCVEESMKISQNEEIHVDHGHIVMVMKDGELTFEGSIIDGSCLNK